MSHFGSAANRSFVSMSTLSQLHRQYWRVCQITQRKNQNIYYYDINFICRDFDTGKNRFLLPQT